MSCPDCVTGYVHTDTPKGTEIKVADINAYATGDEASKRIIVIGADVFGWKLVNTRLLADEYAAKGFRVIVPDFFNGWELPTWTMNAHDPNESSRSFFKRYVLVPASLFIMVPCVISNIGSQVSRVTSIVSALRTAHPDANIGFVGFCFGGRFAISQNFQFDATVACHPSLVKFPAELDGIKGPFSLAVAATDRAFDAAKAKETERILKEKGLKDIEVVVYEGVSHGWAVRANLADEKQKQARDDAVKQVVGWFEKYLTSDHAESSTPATS
ncbi:alpha/beta-hydrolase [Polyporus arcularius HHB13444]|uniref:Alpha/beta-hydrolase n=1 Tax=Polyporus arcularius HHB13444 TaxID=1314778 RepID=A0A5C3PVG0_9APHY|nr:alpha/beta-hydrolase [Polyporus arcularius HHB13444]